ncbi:uncharacterized protein LOC120634710, partial [Pararge aegeria]|uniref:uncharacterized protein LOC120634710 n=1 Tax=Pararge aegeria TaxID=116150 RepID=UPI0019D23E74
MATAKNLAEEEMLPSLDADPWGRRGGRPARWALRSSWPQANLNHCARAQDLLIQHMAEWQIQVATAAEPYFIPTQSNWAGDVEGSVAVVVPAHGIPLVPQRSGPGFVAVVWGEVTLIGVYFSPNKPLSAFEAYLRSLEPVVRGAAPTQVILMGDLNAKSAAWGSPITDLRGVE